MADRFGVPRYTQEVRADVFRGGGINTGRAQAAAQMADASGALFNAGQRLAATGRAIEQARAEQAARLQKAADRAQAVKDTLQMENEVRAFAKELAHRDGMTPTEKEALFSEQVATYGERFQYLDDEVRLQAEEMRARVAASGLESLQSNIDKLNVARAEANLYGALDELERRSSEDLGANLQRAQNLIGITAHEAGWDELETYKVQAKVKSQWTANYIRRRLSDDPYGMQKSLTDPAAFPGLDEEKRTVLLERADRLVEADQARRIRLAEKAEHDAERAANRRQESSAAALRIQMFEGKVTEADLVTALKERRLKVGEFNSLLSAVRSEREGQDDPSLVVDLTNRIYKGEVKPEEITAAFANGKLSAAGAKELLAKEAAQSGEAANPLKSDEATRARDYVQDQVTGPRKDALSFGDPDAPIRTAEAIREFDKRVLGGEAPWVVADDVKLRYRPSPREAVGSLPRPMFMVGQNKLNIDVDASAKKLADAYKKGEIDKATMAREAAVLRQYEEAYSATQHKAKP